MAIVSNVLKQYSVWQFKRLYREEGAEVADALFLPHSEIFDPTYIPVPLKER